MEDYKDHASILGTKENFTPAEEFNFKLVSKIQVEENNTNSSDKHYIPTHFYIELDVSYVSQHTFSKVTVAVFENYIIYCKHNRGVEPTLRKMICSSTCLDIMRSNG